MTLSQLEASMPRAELAIWHALDAIRHEEAIQAGKGAT